MLRSAGIGPAKAGTQGPQGERGETGQTGATGAAGAKGGTGERGPIGLTGVAGAAGAKGDVGPAGAQGIAGPKGDAGATGATGPQGAKGDPGTPAPTTGRLEFIGNINFTETLLVSLSVGMRRRTVALAGVLATDKLQFALNGAQTAGCEVVNVQQAGAGNVSVGYYTPLLGIGATYAMPISIYRIT